ncbi:MAG: endo-1,4-beta-xylanase, partial [Hyphomicrobiales bacterium]|nr:endo-1,4-beta-xylanase [Hyphomicrobiales bacterium]
MISRRALLAGAGATAGTGAARASDAPTLAGSARSAGLLYGASIDDAAFAHPAYEALYAGETAIVATDVAFKFDWLRPAPDRFDWSRADRIVDWAAKNG